MQKQSVNGLYISHHTITDDFMNSENILVSFNTKICVILICYEKSNQWSWFVASQAVKTFPFQCVTEVSS